jgi:hypothetical protein
MKNLRKSGYCWLLAGLLGCALSACSSAKGVLSGETAFVVPERVRLRSSTAEAARAVGEVKGGDQVTITERKNEGNQVWANINGPGGVTGWIEARHLVKREIAEAAQKIAEEMRNTPTQAIGKSKASLKLRLTPDRNTDDNVAYLLPAGTQLEIVARDRQLRPEKLEPKPTPTPANARKPAAPAGPKFDEWYKVRLNNYTIVPAGWIYGGSVELDVPSEISFYASTDRRIVGWQKLGSTQDEQGQSKDQFLVAERKLFGSDERLDFDRLRVLVFDPKRREYGRVFADDVPGRFPIVTQMEGNNGKFQVTSLDKNNQEHQLDYSVETGENGKLKVARVAPKETGKAK